LSFRARLGNARFSGLSSGPPRARRRSLPFLEGAEERVAVLVSQQERRLAQLDSVLPQVYPGQFAARLLHELLKRRAGAGEPALKE
jgi:hypothetical protein